MISAVNMTKSAGSCRFGHVYLRNPKWKTSFFVAQRKIAATKENCKYKKNAWKMSVFGVILVRRISPSLVWKRENADQNNYEYGHFLPVDTRRRRFFH